MEPSGVPNRARWSSSRWAVGLACTRRKSGSSATSITPYGDIASASQVETSGAPSELRSAGRHVVRRAEALATAASARPRPRPGRVAVRDHRGRARSPLTASAPAVGAGARSGGVRTGRCLDDVLDVLDDPLEGHALLEVAVGPDGHGLLGHLGRAEAGEDDDLGLRDQATDRRQRLEAVHHGHRQVEQHDVGLLEADALDAGQAVAGLADDLEPATREGQAQQLAQVVGVVDDDDAHRSGALGDRDHRGRPLGLGGSDGLGGVGGVGDSGSRDRRRRRERCAAGRARRARSRAGR